MMIGIQHVTNKIKCVADLQDDWVYFVQGEACVKCLNEMYGEDYDYYFIQQNPFSRDRYYGSYSAKLNATAYYVGKME